MHTLPKMQQNFWWNILPTFKSLSKIKKCIQGSVHNAPNAHTSPYAAHTLPQMHTLQQVQLTHWPKCKHCPECSESSESSESSASVGRLSSYFFISLIWFLSYFVNSYYVYFWRTCHIKKKEGLEELTWKSPTRDLCDCHNCLFVRYLTMTRCWQQSF